MNNYTRRSAMIIMFMGLVGAATVRAASSSDPVKASGPSTLSKDDIGFFESAAQIGMTEVQAATIASSRALGANTKAYASTMTSEHTANNEALKSLARSKGVSLPTQLDKPHQKFLDNLQNVDTKEFDAAYAKDMTAGHKDAIDLFEKTARSSKDTDVREFAKSTLPTLRHHLEMAKNLNGKS